MYGSPSAGDRAGGGTRRGEKDRGDGGGLPLAPETIVLSSPHSVMYADYFHVSPGRRASGDLGRFRAGGVRIDAAYDEPFTALLEEKAERLHFPAGTLGERDPSLDHGTVVPLYFINQAYTDYRLVRVGLSGLSLADHYRFGPITGSAR